MPSATTPVSADRKKRVQMAEPGFCTLRTTGTPSSLTQELPYSEPGTGGLVLCFGCGPKDRRHLRWNLVTLSKPRVAQRHYIRSHILLAKLSFHSIFLLSFLKLFKFYLFICSFVHAFIHSFIVCLFIILKDFFIERERERERGRDTEGEAGSMQGARCGTGSRVSRITPQAAGGAKPLRHRGCPPFFYS